MSYLPSLRTLLFLLLSLLHIAACILLLHSPCYYVAALFLFCSTLHYFIVLQRTSLSFIRLRFIPVYFSLPHSAFEDFIVHSTTLFYFSLFFITSYYSRVLPTTSPYFVLFHIIVYYSVLF